MTRYNRIAKRLVRSGILLTSFLLFSNYMFLSPDMRTRQRGLFPIVKFEIGNFPAKLSFADFDPVVSVTKASGVWFEQSKARIDFQYSGSSVSSIPASPNAVNCEDANMFEFAEKKMFVGSLQAADPDCTAEICTYNWICVDEIIHSDIVFKHDAFQNDIYPLSLSRLEAMLAQSFGHAAGLNHCYMGDTEAGCSLKAGTEKSNPGTGSIMANHPLPESLVLSQDDIAGIEKLYGIDDSGFPRTGEYALNEQEAEVLSNTVTEADWFRIQTPYFEKTAVDNMYLLLHCEPPDASAMDILKMKDTDLEPKCETTEVQNRSRQQEYREAAKNTTSVAVDSYSAGMLDEMCSKWNDMRNKTIQEEIML